MASFAKRFCRCLPQLFEPCGAAARHREESLSNRRNRGISPTGVICFFCFARRLHDGQGLRPTGAEVIREASFAQRSAWLSSSLLLTPSSLCGPWLMRPASPNRR